MTLLRKVATTITFQALGPLSILLVVWMIGVYLGPQAQGKFSVVKSLIELMVALMVFGLPQSFVYAINRLNVQRGQLIRWTFRYGLICLGTGTLLIMFMKQLSWSSFGLLNESPYANLLLVIAMAGLVVHALLRGVLLTVTDGSVFSFLTILPALTLVSVVAVLINAKYFEPTLAYFIAGVVSAFVGSMVVRTSLAETKSDAIPWRALFNNGSAIYLQGLAIAAQPLLTQTLIKTYGGGYEHIAFFSLAVYVYQAGVIPLTMVAPILFNRWTVVHSRSDISREVVFLLRLLPAIIALVAVGYAIAPTIAVIAFGQAYQAAVPAIQIMLLAIPLLYVAHVGMPALMSLGLFRANTVMVIIRMLICVLSLAFLFANFSGDRARLAALAWLIAELVMAMMVILLLIRKLPRMPKSTRRCVC